MQERDSFQLTYSQSLRDSKNPSPSPADQEEEKQQLSPNKQSMLQTFKITIMGPVQSQEVISSLTSVQCEQESMPCPEGTQKEESENEENERSLPSTKEIKRIASGIKPKSKAESISIIQPPRTLSQKEALTNRILQATQFLARGVQLQKYCFGREKIEHVILFFSEDAKFMGLYSIYKKNALIIPLDGCTGITSGLKSEKFNSYLQSSYKIPEDHSFSILFKDRSFDFVAQTPSYRDRIVTDLKFLMECFEDTK